MAELKHILQNTVVKDAPINIKFPPTPLPCVACLQVNTIASQVPPSTATHRNRVKCSASTTWARSHSLTREGNPYINMITDLSTGAAIATTFLENKAHTALAQEVSLLRRAHRAAAPLGGTQPALGARHGCV